MANGIIQIRKKSIKPLTITLPDQEINYNGSKNENIEINCGTLKAANTDIFNNLVGKNILKCKDIYTSRFYLGSVRSEKFSPLYHTDENVYFRVETGEELEPGIYTLQMQNYTRWIYPHTDDPIDMTDNPQGLVMPILYTVSDTGEKENIIQVNMFQENGNVNIEVAGTYYLGFYLYGDGVGRVQLAVYDIKLERGAYKTPYSIPYYNEYHVENGQGDLSVKLHQYGTASGYQSVAAGPSQSNGDYSFSENLSNFANGSCSHAEGNSTYATGNMSHSEGQNTTASGNYSHAEGSTTKAVGISSHAEGYKSEAKKDYSHVEGQTSIANSVASHAEGYMTYTGKSYPSSSTGAHAEGYSTIADGLGAHAEGRETNAYGGYGAHAEGYLTISKAAGAHAEGRETIAAGNYSHTEGANTEAMSNASHAGGYGTQSLQFAGYAIGTFNKMGGSSYGYGASMSAEYLIIGNGSSDDARSNCLRVLGNGSIYIASGGAYNTSGADYGEYFEWLDKNIDNEDRIGFFVTNDGDKIKKAKSDDYIIGVISGISSVIGNADEDYIHRFKKDKYGRMLKKEETISFKEHDGEEYTKTSYIENEDYDPSQKYISRAERSEWDVVGMLGVVIVRDDGTCKVNGFCKCNDDSIATASDNKHDYRVLARIDEETIKIILR